MLLDCKWLSATLVADTNILFYCILLSGCSSQSFLTFIAFLFAVPLGLTHFVRERQWSFASLTRELAKCATAISRSLLNVAVSHHLLPLNVPFHTSSFHYIYQLTGIRLCDCSLHLIPNTYRTSIRNTSLTDKSFRTYSLKLLKAHLQT